VLPKELKFKQMGHTHCTAIYGKGKGVKLSMCWSTIFHFKCFSIEMASWS